MHTHNCKDKVEKYLKAAHTQTILALGPHFSCGGSMSLKTWTVSVLLELTRYMSSVLKDRQLI